MPTRNSEAANYRPALRRACHRSSILALYRKRLLSPAVLALPARHSLLRYVQSVMSFLHFSQVSVSRCSVGAYPWRIEDFIRYRAQLRLIDSCLRPQSIRQQPLKLRCQGLGLFSDTLYLRIDCNDALAALVTKLNEALTFLGYSKESREFVPHITLARFRASTPQGIFASILEKYRDTLWGELSVDSIVLYRSETLAKGARYSAIVRYSLGG